MTANKTKDYIGDGVYVQINDCHQMVLTTENGIVATNTIFLEDFVFKALVNYAQRMEWPNG